MSVRIGGYVTWIWRIVLLLGLACPVWAENEGPAELPPDDFTGVQYIDSAGCAFLRDGLEWTPRLDRDDMMICGYPPSVRARRGHEAVSEDPAQALAELLAEGLQDLDLADDPEHDFHREPVETPRLDKGGMANIAAAVQMLPNVRALLISRSASGRRVCDLLGYPSSIAGAGGAAATLGLCSGKPQTLKAHIIQADASMSDSGGHHNGEPVSDNRPKAISKTGGERSEVPHVSRGVRLKQPPIKSGKEAHPTGTQIADRAIEMIPADARYVQIGRYVKTEAAQQTIRHITSLGYPVARRVSAKAGSIGETLMAGPFKDRRGVVAALSHLRAAGYPNATARIGVQRSGH